jgi:hypothetical protein
MKKVRTLKELQNHPFVSHIDYEYQYGIFDETDYIYLLYLIDGKQFECLASGMITSPTIKQLIIEFYYYDIISI